MYNEIEGDIIELALAGSFDVIAHGCNCFCTQAAGIAKSMNNTFNTISFEKENIKYQGDINKLGTIDYSYYKTYLIPGKSFRVPYFNLWNLIVVNAYTQYKPGANLDIEALELCLRKINHQFKDKHIGLPQIGCGIAGGDWNIVKNIIIKELKDCRVTVVIYNK